MSQLENKEQSTMNKILATIGLNGIDKKKLLPLTAVLILGLTLMWLASGNKPDVAAVAEVQGDIPQQTGEKTTSQTPEQQLEAKLTNILGKIAGVGEVSVSLTLAEGAKTEYAVNANTTIRNTDETDSNGGTKKVTEETRNGQLVLDQSSSNPIAVQESMPKVQGVLIVAEGGGDARVCQQITQAVSSLLAVSSHKIIICPSGKE